MDERFRVTRREVEPGVVEVALVRVTRAGGPLRRRELETAVAARRFRRRAHGALDQWEGALREAISYAERGQLGCYVTVDPLGDGSLRVRLVERRIAPDRVIADILAERVFDATEPGAVAGSAEAVAELRAWAQRRNEAYGAAEHDRAAREDDAGLQRADRRREAAELAAILDRTPPP